MILAVNYIISRRATVSITVVRLLYAFLFILCCVLLSACSEPSELDSSNKLHLHTGQVMGTWYSVKYLPPSNAERSVDDINTEIHAKLARIDLLMSTYKATSEVSRFNAVEPGVWFDLSPQTYEVIELAQDISAKTLGAFDISVARLVDLWGFGPEQRAHHIPDADQLKQVLTEVGYENLKLHGSQLKVQKETPLHIDLSAIAKGFGVDQVADYLDRIGVESFLVEVGGEIRTRGMKPNGQPWRVAIESPATGQRGVHSVVNVTDLALATSGDYRNYFEENGQRFSHTIDPKTGAPITHNLASVTVISSTAAEADALATAFSVMGPDQAMAYAKAYNVSTYLIVKEREGFVGKASEAFLAVTRDKL